MKVKKLKKFLETLTDNMDIFLNPEYVIVNGDTRVKHTFFEFKIEKNYSDLGKDIVTIRSNW